MLCIRCGVICTGVKGACIGAWGAGMFADRGAGAGAGPSATGCSSVDMEGFVFAGVAALWER